MKRRNAIILAVVVAVAFGVLYFFYGGHAAPAGQKPLTELSASQLQNFRADFNQSASQPRMIVMLSPTWPICMQGASALQKLLTRHRDIANLRVFVVWEPVLPTDLAAPSTATMDRVPDGRVSQFWDPKRLLSHAMGEHDRRSVIWDYVAIYKPGETWAEAPPKPVYEGSPVVRSIGPTDGALRQLSPR